MPEVQDSLEGDRLRREKYYAREGLSQDFSKSDFLSREAGEIDYDFNSIEYQARYDIWRERAMLPGMIESADTYAPGFSSETVKREPLNDNPEWDLAGGNITSSEPAEWTIESEEEEEFNQSHVSGTAVKVDAEGNIEDVEDLDVLLNWQIATEDEVRRIRNLVRLIEDSRRENAGFVSQETDEGMRILALGGEANLEAYRDAYGEYQKKGFSGGFLLGFRDALADTGDLYAAFLIASPFGPLGMVAAVTYLLFEDRYSFQQLNEPALAEQRALFLQLLFQAEGNAIRTAALIDAFESGDSAGRHAAFLALVLAEMAAGGGGASLLRGGLRRSRGLRRLMRKMSPSARRRFRELRKERRRLKRKRQKKKSSNWKIPDKVLEKIPVEWGSPKPNKKGVGLRWQDPKNSGNGVRIDQGIPGHNHPSQRVDHVIVRYQGSVIGRDGKPLQSGIKLDPVAAHVPLSEYINWRSWYAP